MILLPCDARLKKVFALVSFIGATLLSPPGGLGSAVSQELTPTEQKTILEEIEKIEKTLNDSRGRNNVRVLGQLREAVASPNAALNYYLDAVKSSEWTKKGKRETEWREWRDGREEFKDSGYAKARQYQIRYLILTIQAAMLADDDEAGRGKMLTELVAFLNGMIGSYDEVVNHNDVLRESVLSGAIATDTQLDLTLDKPEGWSLTPLSIDSIYENSILPHYRKSRNATSLRNAWESRISQLTTLEGTVEPVKMSARGGGGGGVFGGGGRIRGGGSDDRDAVREQRKDNAEKAAERLAEFKKTELPNLEWEMERDTFVFGDNRSASARKLGSHIRAHLDHSAALGWIAELKKLASGEFEIDDYVNVGKSGDSGDSGDSGGTGR